MSACELELQHTMEEDKQPWVLFIGDFVQVLKGEVLHCLYPNATSDQSPHCQDQPRQDQGTAMHIIFQITPSIAF